MKSGLKKTTSPEMGQPRTEWHKRRRSNPKKPDMRMLWNTCVARINEQGSQEQ